MYSLEIKYLNYPVRLRDPEMNLRLFEKRADGFTLILLDLGQMGIKDTAFGFSISFLKDLGHYS